MIPKLKTGPWKLSELKDTPQNNRKVFSCFHCGGGSTMGYKLAGYEVLGGVEIDPEMMRIYKTNHNPKHSFLMGVQDFNKLQTIPKELFDLDILDGSPPCSSFSMSGSREKAWGEKKMFREGQAEQVLDDLFFEFIRTVEILKPKIVIAENVKGLVIGKAKGYVKMISDQFDKVGYDLQLFLLNAAFMGVPQKRERVFFIARRKDLSIKKFEMNFNETPICFSQIDDGFIQNAKPLTPTAAKYWPKTEPGKSFSSVHEKGSLFNWIRIDARKPLNTLASGNANLMFHHSQPRLLTDNEWINGQTFPLDYNFLNNEKRYVCGMSVPPFMMQRVSTEIAKQLGWY